MLLPPAGPAAFLWTMPTLFIDKDPLRDRLGEALDRARASVHAVPDHEAVGRGRDEWVDALAASAGPTTGHEPRHSRLPSAICTAPEARASRDRASVAFQFAVAPAFLLRVAAFHSAVV